MHKRSHFALTGILLLSSLSLPLTPVLWAAEKSVVLNTSVASPYQVEVNGELSGMSVDILQCVFAAMDKPFEVQLLPWARAVEDLRSQSTDGIFTAMPASELDHRASLSYPFALEKWYWYGDGANHKGQRIVGGIRSSNQVTWLENSGDHVDVLVNSLDQLVKLLQTGRINTLLADERTMHEQLLELGLPDTAFPKVFSRYMPLGIYFSNRFLNERPGFLTDFNQHMKNCAPDALALTEHERGRLNELVREQIMPLLADLPILKTLNEANKVQQGWHEDRIHTLDQRWITEAAKGGGALIESVSNQPLSEQLRRKQLASHGLLGEVFLVSARGVNAAQSQPTSDYYQADEAFFDEAFHYPGKVYVGPIQYDVSSHRFQVKVAWAVRDSDGVRGVMAIGLNVEEALREMDGKHNHEPVLP
ncbi:hypothetical protein ACQUQU_05910 [Thalassolituus sp. LLYu03]|uniref:hypothetical protein n=1 Tax=Thalassolituus sp. LLYu03 TaxID=3421656 RepID=UPI003D27DA30